MVRNRAAPVFVATKPARGPSTAPDLAIGVRPRAPDRALCARTDEQQELLCGGCIHLYASVVPMRFSWQQTGWDELAKIDPRWAVLSVPAFRDGGSDRAAVREFSAPVLRKWRMFWRSRRSRVRRPSSGVRPILGAVLVD
jgi:hypothetical protein